MIENNSAMETETFPKGQLTHIILLLATAVILMLIGSVTSNRELIEHHQTIGASFYIMASICFLVCAYKLFKHRIAK
jgi:hypothetical protein